MILVDTSVWIDHLRVGDRTLARLLQQRKVLGHPWVAGEIALGSLSRRSYILDLLANLPQALVASAAEIRELIETRRLHGRGVGYVDAGLLAASLLSGAKLWSRDRRLELVTVDLGLAAVLPRRRSPP